MTYLLKKEGRFYYNRRVPALFRRHDSRRFVRFALNTDSKKEAMRLAFLHNEQIEEYWKQLVREENKHNNALFNEITTSTKLMAVEGAKTIFEAPKPVDAAIIPEARKPPSSLPPIMLDEALDLFWDFAKDKILNKSPNQIRKWKSPRRKAMENFIQCIGNKPIINLTRADSLKFRDWWIDRIEQENMVENSANKNFIHVKTIVETVSENLDLKLDIKHLFGKLLLMENDETEKLPFSSEYIISTLLNDEKLAGLNNQARGVLYAISETGAGITELINLMPSDIILDHEIPHIIITPRQKNGLKTKYRKRAIPLVGYALDAFKECPGGFTQYHDRPDSLSAVLNKYLREHNLLPSENHTVNSLRHSFQDRLLAANAPDRVQADLMGHKFERPRYGEGATLRHKLEWLNKIKLKPIMDLHGQVLN